MNLWILLLAAAFASNFERSEFSKYADELRRKKKKRDQPGMSTCTKVWLGVGAVAGVCLFKDAICYSKPQLVNDSGYIVKSATWTCKHTPSLYNGASRFYDSLPNLFGSDKTPDKTRFVEIQCGQGEFGEYMFDKKGEDGKYDKYMICKPNKPRIPEKKEIQCVNGESGEYVQGEDGKFNKKICCHQS